MAFILNDNVKIRYEVEGNGDCLVLQHGFFGSIEDWYEYGYVDNLKKKFQLILIDARGHGKSDKPHISNQYSLYLRALDVIKVLDAQKIERCTYMGYSMGGWISFGLMKWFEKRFNSFILDAIHPYENNMLSLRNAVMTLDILVPQYNISERHKMRFLNNDREALLASIEETRNDSTNILRNITVRCLMMAGENDEIYKKVKGSSELTNMIEFVTIPEADHGDSLYKSNLIIPNIERFIALSL
ncbi:alpha/beta hydrolase [Desulfosporosinus sp. Sb-LF]|uniref:alpha/beta fold hydrolase n=1 Tax=Desulfosporosinus sp. Sb-LF TaxID=2560027 RepID=UPI00107F7198|nr:alpha/beta hydrolase [Desulfosporosinus sp. Sb-LF]TGE30933.1 alpha/beta hydrolase [Desulfosporosinus sp. Sb-LF]